MEKLGLEFKLKNGQEFPSKRQDHREEGAHHYPEEDSKVHISLQILKLFPQ